MPDYDLGRARGEIVITADTRGADEAAASVAKVEAESAVLNRTLGQTQDQLGRTEQGHRRTASAADGHKQRVNELRQAEEQLKRVLLDANATQEQITRARRAATAAARNAEDAEKALHSEISRGSIHLRQYANEIEKVESKLKSLASTMTGVVATAFKSVGILGGVGVAGGAAGLLGGGGVQSIIAVTEAVSQLSGAFLLLPAAVAGAGAALGTLAVGFHGVGDALKAMDDPAKFTMALRELAPAAQQAVRTIASFQLAAKGAMQQVQQSLFAPIVADIQPLIYTWLPALMRAGQQLAGVFGQAAHIFAQWLQQPQVMAAFQGFINNLSNAFHTMLPAIQAIANAFLTLTSVGGQAFPRIAESIVRIANAFNAWVQQASSSGKLTEWINGALDGFTQLWEITKNLFSALSNINAIGTQFGGGLLSTLTKITAEFNAWTESTRGKSTLAAFFQTAHEAAQTLSPILRIIGEQVLILFTNLMKLGTQLGPGISSFFSSFGTALNELVGYFSKSGGGINDALVILGKALIDIVQAIGPSLPMLFHNFAEALRDLAPVVRIAAEFVGELFGSLTPTEISTILGLVGAFRALALILPVVRVAMIAVDIAMDANPIGLLVIAIAALIAAGIYLATHWDQVKAKANELWDVLKAFGTWIQTQLSEAWNQAIASITDIWNNFTNAAKSWGSNLVRSIIDGVYSMFQPLTDAASWIAGIFTDHNKTDSPAKKGPLHDVSPNQMGSKLVENFASGITASAPVVEQAASGAAGSAAQGFTSAGVGGTSGKAGQSGFDQWIKGLTDDLSAWSSIGKNSWELFKSVADIVVDTTKIVASIWNQGDNPLTRPGGIAGPPGAGLAVQQDVPGVPRSDVGTVIPGKAPLPKLTPQGNLPPGAKIPAVPQAGVPGVPSAPGPGSAGAAAPTTPAPGDSALVVALKAKGFSPQQIRLIEGFSQVEGNNPAGNPTLGWTDAQLGGDTSLQGHVDALAQQFKDRASVAGPFPEGGTDQQQAQWIANVVGQNASPSDWQGNAQPPDYVQRVVSALPPAAPAASAPPASGGFVPSQGVPVPGIAPPGMELRRFPNGAIVPVPSAVTGPLPNVSGTATAQGAVRDPLQSFLFDGTQPGDAAAANRRLAAINQPGSITGQAAPSTQGQAPPNSGPGFQLNPATQANIPLQGSTTNAVLQAKARGTFTNPPLYKPGTESGGYGSTTGIPQWAIDIGAQFGLKPSTYGDPASLHGQGYAFDFAADPSLPKDEQARRMDAFATFIQTNFTPQTLELIHANSQTGQKWGVAGGKDVVGTGYYEHPNQWPGHDDYGPEPHVHWATDVAPIRGGPAAATANVAPRSFDTPLAPPPVNPAPGTGPGRKKTWQEMTPDEQYVATDMSQRGVDPGQYGFAPPPTGTPAVQEGPGLQPVPLPAGQQDRTQSPWVNPPGLPPGAVGTGHGDFYGPGTTGVQPYSRIDPTTGAWAPVQGGPGQPTNQQSPLDQFSSAVSSAGNIVGDAFKIFDDIIKNISATAAITDQFVRGVANTEDIMHLIDNFQTFITTAADVAKLVGDVGGMIAGAGGGDPSGMTGAVGAGIQMIAGLVQAALTATNAAIDLGQQAYHEIAKYVATVEGFVLGGINTGPLGGNVRMLLNTNTGQVITYSEDNPQNQNTKQLPPGFAKAYGGNRQAPAVQQNNLNMYVGPGPNPMQMMSDTMWLVGTGAPQVASVAGHD